VTVPDACRMFLQVVLCRWVVGKVAFKPMISSCRTHACAELVPDLPFLVPDWCPTSAELVTDACRKQVKK
jgi:hypothetical protein